MKRLRKFLWLVRTKVEYFTNSNQIRHQVKFSQRTAMICRVPWQPQIMRVQEAVCFWAGHTHTAFAQLYALSTSPDPWASLSQLKFKGLDQITSKILWIYIGFLDRRRAVFEGEKGIALLTLQGSLFLLYFSFSKWALAYLVSFYTQMLQENELGQSLNLG